MQKKKQKMFAWELFPPHHSWKALQYEHQVMNQPADCARRSARQEEHCLTQYMLDRGDKLAR